MVEGPLIELKNVGVRFGKLVVHRDLSFKITPGESVTILGPSGTGKTLILKLLIGLLMPTSGEVWVMGKKLNDLDEEGLGQVRRNIGMLFQGAALFDSLSVFENIAYSLREREKHTELEIADIVREKLELVGLRGIEKKFPPELSGGQKKRVGLARALASTPWVMLLDEPTTGLDPTAIRQIDELICLLRAELNITAISVTHDIESARRISDRWLLLDQGRVVADGPVNEISDRSKEVKDFVSGNWRDT